VAFDNGAGPGGAHAKPIENAYWGIPGRFLAGEYPGAKDPEEARRKLRSLVAYGYDTFIDLTTKHDKLAQYDSLLKEVSGGTARHLYHGIEDVSVPATPGRMGAILDAIDDALCEGRRIYLHCWGGVGRTGTVVGCWLRRHRDAPSSGRSNADVVLQELAECWKTNPKSAAKPVSPETREQVDYIRGWSEPDRLVLG